MAQRHQQRLPLNRNVHLQVPPSQHSVPDNDVHRSYSYTRDQDNMPLNSGKKSRRRPRHRRRASSASSSSNREMRTNSTLLADPAREPSIIEQLKELKVTKPILTTTDPSSHTFEQQVTTCFQIPLPKANQLDISIEPIKRECVVCMTEKLLSEFDGIFNDTCVHIERSVCNKCVYENTKSLVEDSIIYFGDITCPEPDCYETFDYHGIRQILVIIGKNTTLFERYDDHLILRQLEKMPDFVWCAHNCGSGQLYDLAQTQNPMVPCSKCSRPTCFKHRIPWHTDMLCEQYDLLKNQPTETDATNKWLELFAKQCPQCQWHIQKYEGCDHMTCRCCKHEFCWECFVDYKLIASQGAHEHKNTCSHYQPNPAAASTTTATE